MNDVSFLADDLPVPHKSAVLIDLRIGFCERVEQSGREISDLGLICFDRSREAIWGHGRPDGDGREDLRRGKHSMRGLHPKLSKLFLSQSPVI